MFLVRYILFSFIHSCWTFYPKIFLQNFSKFSKFFAKFSKFWLFFLKCFFFDQKNFSVGAWFEYRCCHHSGCRWARSWLICYWKLDTANGCSATMYRRLCMYMTNGFTPTHSGSKVAGFTGDSSTNLLCVSLTI